MAKPVVREVGGAVLELAVGDITRLAVDAVVNAANSSLQHGGGVAAAISRRGGPRIQEESNRLAPCPTGGAVVTGAGDLPARRVIHAVGPIWGRHDPDEADRLLASACREALLRAAELDLRSVALPAISTGIYGYPLGRAAQVLLRAALQHLGGDTSLERVVFCLFDDATFREFEMALDDVT